MTEKVEFLNIGQSNCSLQKTSDSPFKTQTHPLKLFSKHKHFPSNHHFLLQGTWLSNLAQQTLFTQARQHWFALAVKVFVISVNISADFSYVSLSSLLVVSSALICSCCQRVEQQYFDRTAAQGGRGQKARRRFLGRDGWSDHRSMSGQCWWQLQNTKTKKNTNSRCWTIKALCSQKNWDKNSKHKKTQRQCLEEEVISGLSGQLDDNYKWQPARLTS